MGISSTFLLKEMYTDSDSNPTPALLEMILVLLVSEEAYVPLWNFSGLVS